MRPTALAATLVAWALPALAQPPAPAPAAAASAPASPSGEPSGWKDTYQRGSRRDPFVSLFRPVEAGKESRPPGLPGFKVEELAVKGLVSTTQGYVAMLLAIDGKSYFARKSQKLFDGEITEMDQGSVTFRQDRNDPEAALLPPEKRTRIVKRELNPLPLQERVK